MQQMVTVPRFAEVRAHGFRMARVLVRSVATSHNIHYGTRQGTRTPVLSVVLARLWPIHGFRFRKHRMVEPSLRGAHPLDANMHRAPLALDALAVPFVDRVQVERAAIAEVQSRPQLHSGGLYAA